MISPLSKPHMAPPKRAKTHLVSLFLRGRALRITEVHEPEIDTGHHCSFYSTCSRWRQQRTVLRQQHGERFGDLSYALGGYSSRQEGGQNIDGPIEQWKPNMEAVKATIEFAKSTRRLQPKVADEESRSVEEAEERRQLRMPSPSS